MGRVFVLLACAATLSACSSSSLPSFDLPTFKSAGGSTQVRVEFRPPGAEARGAGAGPGCRTPCMLSIPDSGLSSVTFSLPGYVPQNVPVRVSMAQQSSQRIMENGVPEPTVVIDPNPVFAQLEVAPPPAPPPKKKAPPKKKPPPVAAAPMQQPPTAQQQPMQQPPGFGPLPQQQPGFPLRLAASGLLDRPRTASMNAAIGAGA